MEEEMYMTEDTEAPASAPEETAEDENTALLPRSFFPDKDLKPGKKCTIEVVHGYEDEVEVKYSKSEDGEKDYEAGEERGAMEMAEAEMEAMAEG